MTTVIRGTDNSVSAPAITGTDSDTGVYFPAANQMALATNGTQAVFIDASQNVGVGTASPTQKLDVNGTAKATTVQATTLSDGTNSTSSTNCIKGSAKAWVNFNGATATIRTSYNVTSVTLNATGDYTVTFTNAMSDANYAYNVSVSQNYGVNIGSFIPLNMNVSGTEIPPTTTACRFVTFGQNTSAFNSKYINVVVFGN